jgi:xanthine/CO dehydrogenase XdhC/CoxF family maturation factor
VPELPGQARSPGEQAARGHDAAADARAQGQHDQHPGLPSGPGARLGQGGRVTVVVDRHRHPEPLFQIEA